MLKNKYTAIFGLILFICSSEFVIAQDEYASVEIKTQKVAGNIYMLTGKGGNIGVIAGDDGVLMIDDQFAPLSDMIQNAVAEISDKPVKFLINTHWHRDHAGGNMNFAGTGTIIFAHENVRKRMSSEQFIKAFSRKIPPSPTGALPVVTFTNDIKFHLNGEQIEVMHIEKAHTDGDSVIFFRNSNVIHMGDTYFTGRYPFIDTSSGGNITGVVNGVEKVLDMIDNDTKVIPGHGTLSNKQELTGYLQMLKTAKEGTEKMMAEGRSLEQVVNSDLLKKYDDAYGGNKINRQKFLSIVYDSLTANESVSD